MKQYLKLKVLATYLSLLSSLVVRAQDLPPYENPVYGSDSTSRISCAADLSTMSEYIKIDMYEYALPAWRNVYKNCPEASKNIYISGVKIFRKLIEETKDAALQAAYFDTLMMNYDNRIRYFGEEGYVLGRKGIDIIRYNDSEYGKAYEAFLRSATVSGAETDLNVIIGLVQTGIVMMKAGQIDEATFLGNYFMARNLVEQQKNQGGNPSKFDRVTESIDKIAGNSGIQDCAVIEKAFSENFEHVENNPALLRIASGLLSGAGCDNSELYASVNEKLFKLDPDAGRAYELARFNIKKENYPKAVEYLDMAIAAEKEPSLKASYLYQKSLILVSKLEKYPEARDAALKAIENKPGWGEPYFVIANAFISGIGSCSGEDFDRKAIYWLATDYCMKAKEADPSSVQKASGLISQYKSSYPSVEDSFFRSLKEGDNYTFNCWINESTTVKMK